jgi:thiol-disulfide isomerase/thioredoxin
MIKATSETHFNELLLKNKYVCVKFGAKWCEPCMVFEPVFNTFANEPEYKNIVFVTVDIDEVPALVDICAVVKLPTVLFYKHGECCIELESMSQVTPDAFVISLNELLYVM